MSGMPSFGISQVPMCSTITRSISRMRGIRGRRHRGCSKAPSGCDSTVVWQNRDIGKPNCGSKKPKDPCSALVHEVYHAFDFDRGTYNENMVLGVEWGQIYATQAQNSFLNELGLEPRQVFCYKIESTTGPKFGMVPIPAGDPPLPPKSSSSGESGSSSGGSGGGVGGRMCYCKCGEPEPRDDLTNLVDNIYAREVFVGYARGSSCTVFEGLDCTIMNFGNTGFSDIHGKYHDCK